MKVKGDLSTTIRGKDTLRKIFARLDKEKETLETEKAAQAKELETLQGASVSYKEAL